MDFLRNCIRMKARQLLWLHMMKNVAKQADRMEYLKDGQIEKMR